MNSITDAVAELFSLMPDSVLFGTGLLYFLTQNFTYLVFAVFVLETVLSHRLLSWLMKGAIGPRLPADQIRCRAGYKVPQFAYQRMFMHDSYPSYGVFSMTAIGVYLGLATSEFSDTMKEMSKSPKTDWASRPIVAYVFIGLLLLSFIGIRAYSCNENLGEILMAVFFGGIVAYLFYRANVAVFGKEGVNFLGLPYLVAKPSDATPIYTCAPSS